MNKAIMFAIITCLAAAALGMDMDVTNQSKKSPQPAGRVTEGFQVSATAENESVISGAPARLRIRIRNVTDRALYLGEAGTEHDYGVRISSDTGRTIPLTAHGKSVLNGGRFYMNLSILIKPGEEREEVIDISKIYDMKTPGNYSVVLERKVGKLEGKGVAQAESNTVHIKVIR